MSCVLQVILVKWNEPYQRLATCDSRGVIFVWIKHEGRWSIELINDRNSQVGSCPCQIIVSHESGEFLSILDYCQSGEFLSVSVRLLPGR